MLSCKYTAAISAIWQTTTSDHVTQVRPAIWAIWDRRSRARLHGACSSSLRSHHFQPRPEVPVLPSYLIISQVCIGVVLPVAAKLLPC